jgi:hypothetical protein
MLVTKIGAGGPPSLPDTAPIREMALYTALLQPWINEMSRLARAFVCLLCFDILGR